MIDRVFGDPWLVASVLIVLTALTLIASASSVVSLSQARRLAKKPPAPPTAHTTRPSARAIRVGDKVGVTGTLLPIYQVVAIADGWALCKIINSFSGYEPYQAKEIRRLGHRHKGRPAGQ